jgi:hypothetical protein
MKVSELTGELLDAWVAVTAGVLIKRQTDGFLYTVGDHPRQWDPSSSWLLAGPIIQEERIAVWHSSDNWCAIHPSALPTGYSGDDGYIDVTEWDCARSIDSPLVAAMRAYVAHKFGDEVPDAA